MYRPMQQLSRFLDITRSAISVGESQLREISQEENGAFKRAHLDCCTLRNCRIVQLAGLECVQETTNPQRLLEDVSNVVVGVAKSEQC